MSTRIMDIIDSLYIMKHDDASICSSVSFALFVFPVSHDCCETLPHSATGLFAVCDCGISCSCSLFSI